jgi:Rrf2 family iron-sulfur cluster assembly transcriptional regulator
MNITSKSRYALKIMMDLAACAAPGDHDGVTHRAVIATRQGIPLDYMDHVLSRLREAGLIASVRGRGGGYRLARQPAEVSVWEIFMAVEDSFQPVQCLEGEHNCVVEHLCSSRDAWADISSAIRHSLSGIILAELVAKRGATPAARPAPPVPSVHECRAPNRRPASSGALKHP